MRYSRTATARSAGLVVAAAASCILLPAPRAKGSGYESAAFGVSNYNGTGECTAIGSLTYADNDAAAFQTAMYDDPAGPQYDASVYWVNSAVDPEDFIDGLDDEVQAIGTDWADVVFFAGHGDYNCPAPLASRYTFLYMGDNNPPYSCYPHVGGSGSHLVFASGGDGSDANYLMMHASTSLRYCAAQSGNMVLNIDDGGSGTQFVLINGFHNSPMDEGGNPGEITIYVQQADADGLGDVWGDKLSYRGGTPDVECTVTSTTSSSEANASNLFFNGGLKDFKDTGTHSQHWYFYDCDRLTCTDLDFC